MPGYYETYLRGLQQAVPMARLAEQERQNAFTQQFKARQLEGQESQRVDNARRLQDALSETKRHHGETEMNALRSALARAQGAANQGTWEPMSMGGKDVLFNKRTLEILDPASGQISSAKQPGANGGNAIIKPKALGNKEIEDLTADIQGAGKTTKARQLLMGQDVGTARGDPGATGLKGYIPDWLLQRMDSTGVDTRAAITDVGDMKVRERSGKAVPVKEFGRLKSFVPSITDSQSAGIKKLDQFDSEYQRMLQEKVQAFENAGYRVPIALKNQVQRYAAPEAAANPGGSPGGDPAALLQQLLAEQARRKQAVPQ